MTGCRLKRMEMSEMLDVIHVLFEEDLMPTWEHGFEVKNKVRESIYSSMYKTTYRYGDGSSVSGDPEWELGGVPESVVDKDAPPKPYIPPSTPEELSAILGAPLGE